MAIVYVAYCLKCKHEHRSDGKIFQAHLKYADPKCDFPGHPAQCPDSRTIKSVK